jgi:beta-lactamase class A
LEEIEKNNGGRLGMALRDTTTGYVAEHRAPERFPMCSTFKMVAAATVLQRMDKGRENLERSVVFSQKDIVEHSPMTGGLGLSVKDLCDAAMTEGDNTAANLLLASIGASGGDRILLVSWRFGVAIAPHRANSECNGTWRSARHDFACRDAGKYAPHLAWRCADRNFS